MAHPLRMIFCAVFQGAKAAFKVFRRLNCPLGAPRASCFSGKARSGPEGHPVLIEAEPPFGQFVFPRLAGLRRSEEHTSELQSLMRISYAVFCLKKKIKT